MTCTVAIFYCYETFKRKLTGNLTMSAYVDLDGLTMAALELRPDSNESDLETIIRAVYKQVLGNQHLMACDRNESAESLLRNRDITVRENKRKNR